MKAERETVDRLIAHFLADRIGATFEGRISGVTRAGLFVKLDETGADGFVPARTIGDEYFRYEEAQHAHGRQPHRRDAPARRPRHGASWSRPRRSPARCASSLLSEGRIVGRAQRRPSERPHGARAPRPPPRKSASWEAPPMTDIARALQRFTSDAIAGHPNLHAAATPRR